MTSDSVHTFVMILCCGAAALALWVVVRLPQLGPRDLRRALLHILLSIAVGYVTAPAIGAVAAVGVPGAQYVGTFAVALPALTYMFLATAWLMRVMRDFFQGARY
jgi:hypothetical protein